MYLDGGWWLLGQIRVHIMCPIENERYLLIEYIAYVKDIDANVIGVAGDLVRVKATLL